MSRPVSRVRKINAPLAASNAFPQADSLDKIIGILNLADRNSNVDESVIADMYSITQRQGSYYYAAAQYVGVVYKRGGWVKPTSQGEAIARMQDPQDQESAIFDLVLKLPVFQRIADYLAVEGCVPEHGEVTDWVFKQDHKVNDTTAERRAYTALAWIERIKEQFPEKIIAMAPSMMAMT